MEQKIKPKLGNAASLFKDNETTSLYQKKPNAKKKIGTLAAAATGMALLAAAAYLIDDAGIDAKEISTAASSLSADDVSVVEAGSKKDKLFGTVLRADEEGQTTTFASAGPVQLTDQERARLLDIISRQ